MDPFFSALKMICQLILTESITITISTQKVLLKQYLHNNYYNNYIIFYRNNNYAKSFTVTIKKHNNSICFHEYKLSFYFNGIKPPTNRIGATLVVSQTSHIQKFESSYALPPVIGANEGTTGNRRDNYYKNGITLIQ